MKFDRGCTRNVILIGPYAIKYPRLNSFKAFLLGLLANIREVERSGQPHLARVLAYLPFGLALVMERCRVLECYPPESFLSKISGMSQDIKPRNFGLNAQGEWRVIDYGGYGH